MKCLKGNTREDLWNCASSGKYILNGCLRISNLICKKMVKGYEPEIYRKRNDKYTYEKCSTSLNIKEVWGEARSSYFSPIRVANIFSF